jgi:hypothetical protein
MNMLQCEILDLMIEAEKQSPSGREWALGVDADGATDGDAYGCSWREDSWLWLGHKDVCFEVFSDN